MSDVGFPGLGFTIPNMPTALNIFGMEIKFYAIAVTLGFILAYLIATREAKRTKQDPELYLDYLLWLVFPAIIGARLYYILFSLDEFFEKGKGFWQTLYDLINIRSGGLAIYGGLIAGILVAIIFCKKKKVSFLLIADTISMGMLVGQIIGRFGNFFNREAFGGYTNSIFRMNIALEYYEEQGSLRGLIGAGIISPEMLENMTISDGLTWISVHPTFIYEGLWNVLILLIIFLYRKHKKFDGQLGLIYLLGYGVGRFWIEALRTDTLMMNFLNIRVSQLVAIGCVIFATTMMIIMYRKYKKNLSDKPEDKEETA